MGLRGRRVPWEAGRKALAPGHKISSPPCPEDLVQPAVYGGSEGGKLLFGCPMSWGAPQLVPLPPYCRSGAQGGHPPIQAAQQPQGSTHHHSTELPSGASEQKPGAKEPLCRVHCCSCSGSPSAMHKRSVFLLKDEKSLGELFQVACEILTEPQIGQRT